MSIHEIARNQSCGRLLLLSLPACVLFGIGGGACTPPFSGETYPGIVIGPGNRTSSR